jgi:RNA polymerase sigma-70 factor, ECF subfamily
MSRLLIDEAIERLPKGYRRFVILHDICGFEHEEIGQMLYCASGTSKSQLFKARRKLRKLLSSDADNANLQSAL